jgi:hypothetical protein
VKKRSFLLPLAVSLTALAAGGGIVNAKPVTPTVSPATEVSAPVTPVPAKPLVLQRASGMKMTQYHTSHASHASHSSHSSHYSSR